jgi:triacylglycerol lipase
VPDAAAPIVLIHGLCGFDRLFACRRPAREYFPGVRQRLEAAGRTVLVPRVSPTAGITTRAAELRAYLTREFGSRRVHLIGHSMGGLDARYLISALGFDRQVLSLTTVGTPHRGSPFADWGIGQFERFISPILRRAGIPDDAFFDLTTEACRLFNVRVPDAVGVRYFSVAGVCEKAWLGPEWRLPARIVGRAEGPNDGVVSVASAAWGERTEVWAGDHLNLVNWPNRRMQKAGEWRDRCDDYGRLLGRLAAVERENG